MNDNAIFTGKYCCKGEDENFLNCKNCDSFGNCNECKDGYDFKDGICTNKSMIKSEAGEVCTKENECKSFLCKKGICCNEEVVNKIRKEMGRKMPW